jgi:hypothetical protein
MMEALPPAAYAFASILSFILACALVVWIIRAASRKGRRAPTTDDDHPKPVTTPTPSEPDSNPVREEPSLSSAETIPPHWGETIGRRELLSIARTDEGETLVLAGGQPYRRLRDINDPRLGQDTIEAIRAVLVFAEGWIPYIQKWSAESASLSQATTEQPSLLHSPHPSGGPYPARPQSPAATTTIPKPGSMLEPLPLVSQINDLVQRRLEEHPDLSDHLITLATTIDGGLRIYVDHQAFQSIDDITEPKVKSLIQGAIREWEGH